MKKIFVSKKINKNPNGFSMMEVIMSVFLISTGLVAAVQLISGGMATSMDSRDQLIATELTQEGLELVRNIRDNNWVSDPPNDSFKHIDAGINCIIDKDYNNGAIGCDKTIVQRRLNLDNDNFYTHNGATATKFYRDIEIKDDGTGKIITSMVSWKGLFPDTVAGCTLINKCVYAQTRLTKWGEL